MQAEPTSIVIIGATSRDGRQWLEERFPAAPRSSGALLIPLRGAELDAVLWAEQQRLDAQRVGVRLTVGLAELTGRARIDAARAAEDAFHRAEALGGDMTVAHSHLLRAA